MGHIIKNIIRNLAFAGVMAGIGLMGLSLKVRNFDYKSLLIFYQDAEQDNVANHWVEYLLMELADTGEELPNKHVNLKTLRIQVSKLSGHLSLSLRSGFWLMDGFFKQDILCSKFSPIRLLKLPPAGHIQYLHLFKLF